jgi:hypothetical protein
MYNGAHSSIKFSILVLYRKLFTLNGLWFRRAWYSIFTYVILCSIIGILTVLVQCIPISYGWNVLLGANGKCVNLIGNEIGNGVTLAAADIGILVLPMPSLMTLHVTRKQKFQLCGIFSIGSVYVSETASDYVLILFD